MLFADIDEPPTPEASDEVNASGYEVVGLEHDAFDHQPKDLVGQATVEGRTHVDDLNKVLDLDVPESEDYETIGGLLFTMMGRVPEKGEQFDLNGVRFTILEADERRINRVKVTKVG